MASNRKRYRSGVRPVWCPGCGHYGVLNSFYAAIAELDLPPEQIAIASGIGCSGRFPAFVNAYGFHGVHGRPLPLATGIKLGNPELTVIAVGGDGDAYSIGAGHFPHAARRNINITYIVMDNRIYGLTKGQPSPTSPTGMKLKASPYGSTDTPLKPVTSALAYNASFVARGFSAWSRELTEILVQAIQHPGFAFVEVLSPCITFHNLYRHLKAMLQPIPRDHDVTDITAAMALALVDPTLYHGIFHARPRPCYENTIARLSADDQMSEADLSQLLQRFYA
jgi:2-oxoglutarate ferredoxin oxidoreductase subunit beta